MGVAVDAVGVEGQLEFAVGGVDGDFVFAVNETLVFHAVFDE